MIVHEIGICTCYLILLNWSELTLPHNHGASQCPGYSM